MPNTLFTRIVSKHAKEDEWNISTLIPFKGEIIIYDIDENYPYERLKVGDGESLPKDLPFNSFMPIIDSGILYSTEWSLVDNKYSQTVPVKGISPITPIVLVDCALQSDDIDANLEILEAWKLVSVIDVVQAQDSLIFYSFDIPTINIPVNIGFFN